MARSDMFFKATGERTGPITGDSDDPQNPGEIHIDGFAWGMSAPTAVGGAQRTGRTLMKDIVFTKRIDSSSTALMSVMRNNEILTSATLSVRKAGGSPVPYLVITLERARITRYDLRNDIGPDGEPTVSEEFAITFKSITVDHTPQDDTGAGGGASSFTGEVSPDL